jgi:hypothetical protein
MQEIVELLKYIIPSLVTGGLVYYLFTAFYRREESSRMLKYKTEVNKTTLPIRMQACERLTLLMERISPVTLVMRVNTSGVTAKMLHAELLKTIRSEFDHNVTQQIYVSRTTWEAVRNAKEETVKLVNMAGSRMDENAKGTDLAQTILELSMNLKTLPTQVACDVLREETARLF